MIPSAEQIRARQSVRQLILSSSLLSPDPETFVQMAMAIVSGIAAELERASVSTQTSIEYSLDPSLIAHSQFSKLTDLLTTLGYTTEVGAEKIVVRW